MKEIAKKRLIIISYWAAIGVLIWFTREKEIPITERILSFLCFTTISSLITLLFSRFLFQQTIKNRKTTPFVLKFITMTFLMLFSLLLMGKVFFVLETKGIIDSTYYMEYNQSFVNDMKNTIPSILAVNLILCVILLYYEYSMLKQSTLESQLKLLHAQINPHFMFNVLNYLYVLMQKDTELASTLLLKYSDTLRYQLYSGKKEAVKLEHEIQFLKDFIEVENFRWKDKLDVECAWNIENGNKDIPPLLFMPIIENAFKHVSFSKEERGYIYIHLEQKRHIITLKVINTISDKAKSKEESSGLGMENLKKRLEILYGTWFSLVQKKEDTLYVTELIIYKA